ncbi:MAG: hypothetical protein JST28_17320 [Acidobacteria bacterium]|nr:hypothetical protein [Acidobacteriota bacterium]
MSMRTILGKLAALLFAAAAFAVPACAQVKNSGASPIALNAVLADSVTVTLSGNAVNFNLVAGRASNPGSTGITATTTWLLRPSVNLVRLYAYFSSSSAALSDGAGHNIPSANFEISDNGGAFTPLTNTVPFGGANAGLWVSSALILGFNKTGSRSDAMTFNINLASQPNLQAGTYTGTLTIQAQAF